MKLELSNNEVLELKILHRAERDRKRCDRIKAILMFNKGYSAVEIGEVLLIDENTVSGWKDRYLNRKNTQEWLLTQCIGYQGKLDKDQESQIDTYVQENLVSDARQVQSFIKKEFEKTYTRSKMEPGFQIVAGAYSSYVTRAIWKGIRSRFHFGMGIHH